MSTLNQGSHPPATLYPSPSRLLPVRNQAAQQKLGSRQESEALSVFADTPQL